MKYLILIVLMMIMFSLFEIENSVKEGNLSEVEKVEIYEKEKAEQLANKLEKQKEKERIDSLTSKDWDSVRGDQIAEWLFFNITMSIYFKVIAAIMMVLAFGFWFVKKMDSSY